MKNLTSILVVLDRSGSMQAIADDVRGGFDQFIRDQVTKSGGPWGRARLTLVQFDTEYEVVHLDKPVEDIPPLDFVPRGSTALYDALARGIGELRTKIDATPMADRPDKVLVLVITDGQENASREIRRLGQIKDLVAGRQKDGWEFIYIGANVDEMAEGAQIGIHNVRGYQASGQGVRDALYCMSVGTENYRSSGSYDDSADENGDSE